jgi:hypothetical protein
MDLDKFKELLASIEGEEIDEEIYSSTYSAYEDERRQRANRKQYTKSSGDFLIVYIQYGNLYSHVGIFNNKKIPGRINIFNDYRFKDCEWIKYFNRNTKVGNKIPQEDFEEIVKYCDQITRLRAFI